MSKRHKSLSRGRTPVSPVTHRSHLSFDKETHTRFDKTSAVLQTRNHNFSAEYELGFRDRNEGKTLEANPYSDRIARDRWQRGWIARDRYTDVGYKWVEPITDNKIVVWIVGIAVFVAMVVSGLR
jgi:hypothetical protein